MVVYLFGCGNVIVAIIWEINVYIHIIQILMRECLGYGLVVEFKHYLKQNICAMYVPSFVRSFTRLLAHECAKQKCVGCWMLNPCLAPVNHHKPLYKMKMLCFSFELCWNYIYFVHLIYAKVEHSNEFSTHWSNSFVK